jgi:hypothetical protein
MQYRIILELLDNAIPLTLEIYAVLFREGHFDKYLPELFNIWCLFFRLKRKNYNKAPLAFFSDYLYWKQIQHPMATALEEHLPIFNEYFVENFHSKLRMHTQSHFTASQIIREAKIIDEKAYNTFTKTFESTRKSVYNPQQLDYLEKKVAIFLFDLFDNIFETQGESYLVSKSSRQLHHYSLPIFGNIEQKLLPLAWNTEQPPAFEFICDYQECCTVSNETILIQSCGHSFHDCCLKQMENVCTICYTFLKDGIRKNAKKFQKRLIIKLNEKTNINNEEVKEIIDQNEDNNMSIKDITDKTQVNTTFENLYLTWSHFNQ